MDTIGIFGGAFNPPGLHHQAIARRLTDYFNRVIVIPCGQRPDKTTTNTVGCNHRLEMCQIAFGNIPRVELDLSDLENQEFTPMWKIQKRFETEGHICHIIGSDLVKIGADGCCEIQRSWELGEKVWRTLQFGVILRGEPVAAATLPPHTTILFDCNRDSSTEIRNRLENNMDLTSVLDSEVTEYIRMRHLYGYFPEGVTGG